MPAGFRPTIRVFIAHPDAAVRELLRAEVEGEGIVVVGESGDGSEALTMMRDLVPDVPLLAVELPGTGGADVCAALRRELPVCRVLLVAETDDDRAWQGLAAGAYGCWLRDAPQLSLARAVRGTMRRESLPTPIWASRILDAYAHLEAHADQRVVPAPALTDTEREVLERIATGATPDDLADEYDVTAHRVRVHAGYAIVKLYRALADEQLARTAS